MLKARDKVIERVPGELSCRAESRSSAGRRRLHQIRCKLLFLIPLATDFHLHAQFEVEHNIRERSPNTREI